MTMTFVVMGLGTVFNALTNRRDPTSGLTPPVLKALAISLVPLALIVLATELPGLQAGLLTESLDGPAVAGLHRPGAGLPLVVETSKWIRRRRRRLPRPSTCNRVAPERADPAEADPDAVACLRSVE